LRNNENELTDKSSSDRRNELTNKAIQFKADANAIKDEITYIR
jgi:hypothetical protein